MEFIERRLSASEDLPYPIPIERAEETGRLRAERWRLLQTNFTAFSRV
jgi:hypothetical protein